MSETRYMKAFFIALLWVLISATAQAARQYTEFYHTDALGSIVAASDEQGGIIWQKTYDPYGNETITDQNGDEYEGQAYTGKPYDKETGLLYLGQRYYDPELKRFLSMDPIGFVPSNPTSFNRYAYANNNPYRFIDPDGRSAVMAFGGLLNESYNFARGRGFDGAMVMGALVDGYNGEGSGLGWALFEDATSFVPLGSSVKGYRFLKGHFDNIPIPLTTFNVAPKSAEAAADAALAAGRQSGAAAELIVGNRIFTGISREVVPESKILTGILAGTPRFARNKFGFACAEIVCINKAINAGVDPTGGSLRAVNIGVSGNGHKTAKKLCSACTDVADFFGIGRR